MHCPTVLFVALTLAGCASDGARPENAPPSGLLGHPLGSFLRVEGVREEQGKAGQSTLLVDHVGERELQPPVDIWIDNLELPAGVRCRLSGYESGRWIGLPREVEKAEGLLPHQAAWQFQRFFVATSVQAPAALAEQFRAGNRGGE